MHGLGRELVGGDGGGDHDDLAHKIRLALLGDKHGADDGQQEEDIDAALESPGIVGLDLLLHLARDLGVAPTVK